MSTPKSSGSDLGRSASVYLIASIMNAAVPLLLLPILTRELGPAEYGRVAMFQTVVAATGTLTGLNTHGAVLRKSFDGQSEQRFASYVFACVSILVLSTLVALACVLTIGGVGAGLLGIEVPWMAMAVICSAATFLGQLRLGQWQVRDRAVRFGIYQVGQTLLILVLSVVAVVCLRLGALGRVGAQTLVLLIFGAFSFASLSRDGLVRVGRVYLEDVRDALRFGVPLVPHFAGHFLLTAADRVVIVGALGVDRAGVYMVYVQIASGLGMVFTSFNSAFAPWLFSRLSERDDDVDRRVVRFVYAGICGCILLGVLYGLPGSLLVGWIAGSEFGGEPLLMVLLAMGQAFAGAYLMVTNFIFFSKKTGRLSAVTLVFGAGNVVASYLLVNAFGLTGAAAALAVSMFLRFCVAWMVAMRAHPMPWSSWGRGDVS